MPIDRDTLARINRKQDRISDLASGYPQMVDGEWAYTQLVGKGPTLLHSAFGRVIEWAGTWQKESPVPPLVYRYFLPFGYDAAVTNNGNETIFYPFTVDGVQNGLGYKMIRAGICRSMTLQFDGIDNGVGTYAYRVQINGVNTAMLDVGGVTTGDNGDSSDLFQVAFSAGDQLRIEITHNESSGLGDSTMENIAIILEVEMQA